LVGLRKPKALRASGLIKLVDSFAGGVGDAGVDEGFDLWPPCVDSRGEAVWFGGVGVGALLVEGP
jgi:hypothetical protein